MFDDDMGYDTYWEDAKSDLDLWEEQQVFLDLQYDAENDWG